ncbi:ThuA domain-containing protein [Alteromonas sp. KUL49]|nr:ThuA domain-containing protein [Alteromonas sp. KUL49]
MTLRRPKLRVLTILSACLVLGFGTVSGTSARIKVLIVDGQNNHANWPKTSYLMHEFLEVSGRFEVDIYRTRYTWNGGALVEQYPADNSAEFTAVTQPETDHEFFPEFSEYDLVISNFGWKSAAWPNATQQAFVRFIKNGGGFVVVHAANNAFPDWREYNEIIGLGGWGGRNESDGPYLYYDNNHNLVTDTSPGNAGGHGFKHAFSIRVREPKHPIMQSFAPTWVHAKDELYNRLRGPAKNITILASAFDSPEHNGFGRHEPVAFTINYGQGRVFHTTLGHGDNVYQDDNFQKLMINGAIWAAGGNNE